MSAISGRGTPVSVLMLVLMLLLPAVVGGRSRSLTVSDVGAIDDGGR